MAHIAWTLTDVSTGTPVIYSFPINPNEFDPPKRMANITEEISVAANGSPVLFQGRDAVRSGQMSGVCRGAQMFDDLDLWASKWYPLTLTDDLARSYIIVIKEITWKRLRRAIEPNRYDYTIQFLIVG